MRNMNNERIFLIMAIGLLVMVPIAHADFIDWIANIFGGTPTEATESGEIASPTSVGGNGGGALPIQPSPTGPPTIGGAPTTPPTQPGGAPTTSSNIGGAPAAPTSPPPISNGRGEPASGLPPIPGLPPVSDGGGKSASGWDLRLHDVFRLNAGETQIFKNPDGSIIKVTLHEIVGSAEAKPVPSEGGGGGGGLPATTTGGDAGGGGGLQVKRVGAADMTYIRYDRNGRIVDKQRLILLPRDIGFVVEVLKTGGNKALLVIPIPEPR